MYCFEVCGFRATIDDGYIIIATPNQWSSTAQKPAPIEDLKRIAMQKLLAAIGVEAKLCRAAIKRLKELL